MWSPVSGYREFAEPKNVTLISATHGVNEFFSIAIPPIIPYLVADLEITYTEGGLLLTVFFVMYSVFQLPSGVIADRVGKKRLLVGGLIGMVLGLYIASVAESYEALVASQVIAGISGSTYHPTGMSLISDFESGSTEGKAMGVFGFFGMAGIAGAPLIIGGIAGVLDWRIGLAVAATLGLIFTLVFAFLFSEPNSNTTDGSGSDTDQSSDVEERPLYDRVDNDPAANARRIIDRFHNRLAGVLRVPFTKTVLLLLLMTVLVSIQTRAIMAFTTSYVVDTTGDTATMGNAVFFVMLVSGSISSLLAGSLADKVNRGLLGVGASVTTGLLLVVTYYLVSGTRALPEEFLIGTLFVLFFIIGLTMYACIPVKNALVSSEAKREFSGSLFGLTQTGSAIGSASGPAIFGFLATKFGLAIVYPFIGGISLLVGGAFLLLSRNT